jgi:hypothetical protein
MDDLAATRRGGWLGQYEGNPTTRIGELNAPFSLSLVFQMQIMEQTLKSPLLQQFGVLPEQSLLVWQ